MLLWAATRRVFTVTNVLATDELGHISWMANPVSCACHVFVMQKETDWWIQNR